MTEQSLVTAPVFRSSICEATLRSNGKYCRLRLRLSTTIVHTQFRSTVHVLIMGHETVHITVNANAKDEMTQQLTERAQDMKKQ